MITGRIYWSEETLTRVLWSLEFLLTRLAPSALCDVYIDFAGPRVAGTESRYFSLLLSLTRNSHSSPSP